MKKHLLTAVVSALAASAIAGGIAWASIPDTGSVYRACMLNGIGTIRLIDKSLPSTNLMSHCTDKETEVSWNQKGQDGKDGINGTNGTNGTDGKDGFSVTSATVNAGDPSCADGGSKFTAVNGVTYACNGAPGRDGHDGAPGAPGTPGQDGVSGYEIVTSAATLSHGTSSNFYAICPTGKKILSAGWEFTSATSISVSLAIEVDEGKPITTVDGRSAWQFPWQNTGATDYNVSVTGVCASAA